MKADVRAALGKAIKRLLRPLVRILLRNSMPFGVFMEHAKRVYVDVASDDFAVPGRKPSQSRISILTGLTRKEVARLLSQDTESTADDTERYNRAARVISGWVRTRRFQDRRGAPASLPFDGDRKSFAELVRSFSGDMPARAVLDELSRVGAVERLKDGRIKLVTRAYVPRTGEEEKLGVLGQDVAELVATIDHNLTHTSDDAFFQRKVAYDNLTAEFVTRLRALAAQDAQKLLEQLDAVMARHDRDASPGVRGTGRKRAALGIYYFEEDVEEE